jgi:hypothetical protein
MANYRCPVCGANHKEYQANCRLCGQSMNPNFIPQEIQSSATMRQSKRGMKGLVLIGVGVVLAVVAVALVFGLVAGNKQLDQAKDKIVPGANKDGWSTLTCSSSGDAANACKVDPGYDFSVTLPGDRTTSVSSFPGTVDGKLTVWTSKISNDTIVTVGYGKVDPAAAAAAAGATTGTALTTAAAQNYLKGLAQQWLATQGVSTNADDAVAIKGGELGVAGMPAYSFRAQERSFTVNGQPGYAQQLLVLKGDKLFVIQTLSVFKDAEQFDRVVDSLTFA